MANEEGMETQAEFQQPEVVEEALDTREIISRELDKLEAAETEKAEKPEGRDEKGRFAPKAAVQTEQPKEEANPAEKTEETPPEPPKRNPFSSWKKEAQTVLAGLPPEVQSMIEEREGQFHKGLEQYKEGAKAWNSFSQSVRPYQEYLDSLGVSLEQAVPRLIEAERVLRTASPQEKHNLFLQLANDYGIDINYLTQVPFDPYKYKLEQQLAQQQAALMQLSQSRQMAEEAQISQSIEQFGAEHEYFEDVRETMADLLDRGLAQNLEEAYSKAVRLNDDVFAKVQGQRQDPAIDNLKRADMAAKAAKASAVSVKGAPTGVTRAPEPKSTEEAVRIAMAQLGL